MSDINYKNQQCAKFNNVLVNNKTYQEWEYYYFEGKFFLITSRKERDLL